VTVEGLLLYMPPCQIFWAGRFSFMRVAGSISFCMLDVSVLGYLKDYGLFSLIDYLWIY